ncbi:endonuclease VII domain-containing protein [Klenkia brasiliensis]|uniref:endonuclease VII domain-containing protein n=1 Tax=Klenkia brasiliensis TaxID=333142 RepID=UPI001A95EAAC|nr:endonuclease VII domain-containing protein [Klenkia brasiliensis]
MRDLSWVPEGKRWCPTCRSAVDEADYSRNSSAPSGFGAECRPCRRTSQNEAYFVRRYGLTRAEVHAMRVAQADRCAICGDQGAAHLDHAHSTGAVRALLCSRCNMGLGLFLDDPDRLRAAVAYLEKHGGGAVPPATGCTTPPRLGSDRRDRRGTRPGRRSTDRPAHGSAAPHRPTTSGPAEEAHG